MLLLTCCTLLRLLLVHYNTDEYICWQFENTDDRRRSVDCRQFSDRKKIVDGYICW